MRIVDIVERPIGISRYRDPGIPSGGLTTSLVAVVTDAVRDGRPVVGYGFASIGRYAQSGLISERFAPRLLRAAAQDVGTDDGALPVDGGRMRLPDVPGIGFELHDEAWRAFRSLNPV